MAASLNPGSHYGEGEMTAWPKVFLVILNWNGLTDTCECLQSLRAISYPNYEVLVVDNGSRGDDAQQLRQRFGNSIQLIENPQNSGFAGGANIGIRQALSAGTDYVLLLNNDVVVHPRFLDELVSAAQAAPDLAAACPKIYFYHRPQVIYSTGGRINPWIGSARQVGRGRQDRGQYDQPAPRDYADGACMLVSRQALERVGLLDEDYFAYWEETDWCARARDLGLRSYYVPSARIWHKAATSQAASNDFHFLFRRNALLFLRKRKTPLHLLSALLLYLFVYSPLHLLRHPTAIRRVPAELRALLWHATNDLPLPGQAMERR